MKKIVILGAGTAGTMMANRLVRVLSREWQVVLLDRDDVHLYQPGLLFLPFGAYREDELVKPRTQLVDPRVTLRLTGIDRVYPLHEPRPSGATRLMAGWVRDRGNSLSAKPAAPTRALGPGR